jgi:ferredoxin
MEDEYREQDISGLKIEIDRTMCIGSGNCVNLAPEVFELDEENLVDFTDDPQDIDQDRLVEACSLCPVDALGVVEDGEQIVP